MQVIEIVHGKAKIRLPKPNFNDDSLQIVLQDVLSNLCVRDG